jgi:hypothetical protein
VTASSHDNQHKFTRSLCTRSNRFQRQCMQVDGVNTRVAGRQRSPMFAHTNEQKMYAEWQSGRPHEPRIVFQHIKRVVGASVGRCCTSPAAFTPHEHLAAAISPISSAARSGTHAQHPETISIICTNCNTRSDQFAMATYQTHGRQARAHTATHALNQIHTHTRQTRAQTLTRYRGKFDRVWAQRQAIRRGFALVFVGIHQQPTRGPASVVRACSVAARTRRAESAKAALSSECAGRVSARGQASSGPATTVGRLCQGSMRARHAEVRLQRRTRE